MNKKVLLVGSLISIPLLIFLALSFRFDPRTIESPLIGKPAPAFSLVDLDGTRISLEGLRGRPVVLNFWATWCQPCVVEHPVLVDGARRYSGRVHFVGVIYQDEPDLIRRFTRQRGVWGPSLVDPEVRVAIAYGVYGAPETFFIDSQGTIVEKVTGPLDSGRLDRILGALL
jgi:cytochrome c biogenesis protein CcmG/thiol:disulfide interchange protein DsbE